MARIEYEMKFNEQTAEIVYVTDCPVTLGIKVGSDDCFRCQHFHAVLMKQQVECGRQLEQVSKGSDGSSTSRPYSLSSERGKPIQMKIQFK